MDPAAVRAGVPAGPEQAFEVTVRATPSSQRCRLRGRCVLLAGSEALELRHPQSQELLLRWPYRFLRRFGRDKVGAARGGRAGRGRCAGTDPCPPQVTFSFEAGRRCASGEGNFEFDTRQGNEIFQAIEAAIEAQRGRGARGPEPTGVPGEGKGPEAKPAMAPGPGSPRGRRGARIFPTPSPAIPCAPGTRPSGAGGRRAPRWSASTPSLRRHRQVLPGPAAGLSPGGAPRAAERPRDAGAGQRPPGRPTAPKPEHIYDEPEGLSALSLYDEPEEVKGEAWRLQAAPEEPPGLGCPYDAQRDDYAVPKRRFLLQGKEWLGRCDYDNVALKVAKKRNLQ
ncbi:hypothetical protein DUI87_28439 [Hirundo rustica rustica]|uniref:IRS-type PTB domain-containing protein n=1 Tax=Hirundo rustica rustica TaxID=333673 RepID=A0A3M0J8H6_HIRRU|nr:hypothetical protein DUI87_28439 [Hirundo rustica rustica]